MNGQLWLTEINGCCLSTFSVARARGGGWASPRRSCLFLDRALCPWYIFLRFVVATDASCSWIDACGRTYTPPRANVMIRTGLFVDCNELRGSCPEICFALTKIVKFRIKGRALGRLLCMCSTFKRFSLKTSSQPLNQTTIIH